MIIDCHYHFERRLMTDDESFDYAFIKRRIERLFPDKEKQKRLLGENFSELVQS